MALPAQRHKLSRTKDQRRALLKSLAESLIIHESITTTRPKAKALRPYIEKIITRAKEDTQHNRRQARKKLSTDEALTKLFGEVGPRFRERDGGYTRIESAGWRRGDNAEMARISLVEDALEKKATPKTAPATSATTQEPASDKSKSEDTTKKEAPKSKKKSEEKA